MQFKLMACISALAAVATAQTGCVTILEGSVCPTYGTCPSSFSPRTTIMSPSLPQELIEAVITDVGDVESLKVWSLAGSQFCLGSQCILLRSLTLKTHPKSVTPNYDAARYFGHRQRGEWVPAIRRVVQCAQLARPEFRLCIVSLRRLSTPIHYEHTEDIVLAVANTLQHLHFSCKVYSTNFGVPLPQLPKAQSIEFAGVYHSGVWQCIDILFRFFVPTSSRALREITLTLLPIRSACPDAVVGPLLSPLDTAIMAHPAAPHICWRASFAGSVAAVQAQFADFVLAVQDGMLRVHAAGRLVAESSDDHQDSRAGFFPDI
ncbi:hypothetical protein FB451DRAFT_1395682 [Mycena latifolia]|nr:hypothetical protein FB451DRAFT_1395682 [Mycena latifolia]